MPSGDPRKETDVNYWIQRFRIWLAQWLFHAAIKAHPEVIRRGVQKFLDQRDIRRRLPPLASGDMMQQGVSQLPAWEMEPPK